MNFDFYHAFNGYTRSVIILLCSFLIGLILRIVILKILKATATRSRDVVFSSAYERIKHSWFLFIPIIIFLILFPRNEFAEGELVIVLSIARVVILISLAMLAFRLVHVIEDFVVHTYDMQKTDNARERKIRTQLSFLKRVIRVAIVIITISFILLSIDGVRNYGTALITSAGVFGIIIGFAAQKTLSNFLAGFQIAFTQPIKLDDAVLVENEWGWIEEINLTYVVVKIWDLRRLIVPITYFVEKPFQNWTRVTADLIGSVFIYVDYTIPLGALRAAFDEILEQSALWDKKAKVLQVTESTEKSMELRLLMSARNSPEAWDLRCEVREKMISYIQQNYPESLPYVRGEFSTVTAIRGNKG